MRAFAAHGDHAPAKSSCIAAPALPRGAAHPHIVPWSSEMVGAVNGVLGINYWNWNGGGNPQEFTSLSNMVASSANQVLALTRRDPNIMNITGLTGLNELVFNQLGSTLTAIY